MQQLEQITFSEIKSYIAKEKTSYKLILLYLFFEYVRPQSIYPVLEVIPWAQTILLILPAVYFLTEGEKYKVKNTENKLLVIYFGVIVLSSFFAISFDVAYSRWLDFLVWMHIYFLIINIVDTEPRFLVFMLTFLLYNFKMSQFSFRGWAMIGFGFSSWGTGGGPGWFANSGEFGIEMCVFFPVSLYFVIALKKHWGKWKKYFFYLMPFTALTSMISCSSRGAVVGGSATLLWILLRSKYKFKALIGIALIVVIFLQVLPEQSRARFENSGDDSTSTKRLDRWREGMRITNKYPFLGVGYENQFILFKKLVDNGKIQRGSYACHNIFIQCMVELGYTGLTIFILMILYTFVNNYQTRKLAKRNLSENQFIYNMAYGLDGALIGFMVSGFFVTVLYYPYFWINTAMVVALNNIAREKIEFNVI